MKPTLFLCLWILPSFVSSSLNAQNTYSITGNWVANVTELGNTCTIYFNVKNDGTYSTIFDCGNGVNVIEGTWQYTNGELRQTGNSNGRKVRGKIEWKNKDNFIITIIDNGNPDYVGLKRNYIRGKKYQAPKSTSLDDMVQKRCPGCGGVGQIACIGCSDYSYMVTCTVCGGLGMVYLNSKTGERYIPDEYKKVHDNSGKMVYRNPFNPQLVWYKGRWTKVSELPADVKIIGK